MILQQQHVTDPLQVASPEVEAAWQRAVVQLESGQLPEARAALLEAKAAACGDSTLEDRLTCSLAAIQIELGEAVPREELRAILMRSPYPVVLHLAAYQIGRLFELEGVAKKALFYARVSLDHAERTGRPELEARARNLVGNALAAESYFDEARRQYRSAIDLDAEPTTPWHAMLRQNLGYCELALGDLRIGLRNVYAAARRLARLGARRFEVGARIDLAYGLLLADRPDLAARHLPFAIRAAEEFADERALRNALFLQAEAAHRNGDTFAAQRSCQRLGELTGSPDVAEYLLYADVLELVNLRA